MIHEWALNLLRCIHCESKLKIDGEGIRCVQCQSMFRYKSEILDMLGEPHDSVLKEMKAIETLDGSGLEARESISKIIKKVDSENYSPTTNEQDHYPCLTHLMLTRLQVSELLKETKLASDSVVYEIGADHCMTSNLLLDEGYRVIASDISDHLMLATRPDNDKLCRVFADMNRIPLQNGTVDMVWATAAVHHSWNLEQTFAETWRVLKTKGNLVFSCEPMPSWARYPFGRDFGKREKELGINENWISRRQWIDACKRAGFKKIKLHFPHFGDEELVKRLRARGFSAKWIPFMRPFFPWLQVSIHLSAIKE